ncbi:uncharacterized protein KGF55_005558 [Candida pseudojiufengensis]|uniref:uncharacterized protein n=1 Tax=Candida pseudojiufengensis TaxID=497109 RepID=UPI002224B562|nr:uncharacterized protein KGF55_005558 [Candida pseudojiufengensis]KAI5959068.1 hypothetical protein KGF55_005558 [Candida pseudojiufengensis]
MALTRSKLHHNTPHHVEDNPKLNNPDDVSSENILGYDDQPIQVVKKNKKIKFNDDGDNINESQNGGDQEVIEVEDVSDSEEDDIVSDSESDSDEAPEEENVSSSKSKIIEEQQKLKQLELKRQQQIKEQRKLTNERNIKQKKAKQLQEQKEKEAKAKAVAKEQEERQKNLPIELPEFLPENIILKSSTSSSQPQPKHLKEEDFKLIERERTKKLKLETKLRLLKQKNSGGAIKKGPVYVKIQNMGRSIIVPKSENKILKNKHKWLNRKSIVRK